MEIRRFEAGKEEEAIWGIFFRATHESNGRDYHPDLIERWAPADRNMEDWSRRLAKKNPFVALVDGDPVGMAELEDDGFIISSTWIRHFRAGEWEKPSSPE